MCIHFLAGILKLFCVCRTVSTTAINNANSGGEGWWSKLLHVRKIEPGKDSHSKLLSDTERVYELQSTTFSIVFSIQYLGVIFISLWQCFVFVVCYTYQKYGKTSVPFRPFLRA